MGRPGRCRWGLDRLAHPPAGAFVGAGVEGRSPDRPGPVVGRLGAGPGASGSDAHRGRGRGAAAGRSGPPADARPGHPPAAFRRLPAGRGRHRGVGRHRSRHPAPRRRPGGRRGTRAGGGELARRLPHAGTRPRRRRPLAGGRCRWLGGLGARRGHRHPPRPHRPRPRGRCALLPGPGVGGGARGGAGGLRRAGRRRRPAGRCGSCSGAPSVGPAWPQVPRSTLSAPCGRPRLVGRSR